MQEISCKKYFFNVRKVYISPYCRLALVLPNYMKFGIRGQLIDVITCQIFSRSVQGLRSSDTPKLPFPIDLLRRPYNSVCTAVRHCDYMLVTGLSVMHQSPLQFSRNSTVKAVKIQSNKIQVINAGLEGKNNYPSVLDNHRWFQCIGELFGCSNWDTAQKRKLIGCLTNSDKLTRR